MPDDPPYKVGYGRPPQHTRFEKGRSGNPTGRPKGAKSLATLLGEALDRRVVVTENGKRRVITKREIIVAQLVDKSAAADLRAMALLLGMVQQIEARAAARAAARAIAPSATTATTDTAAPGAAPTDTAAPPAPPAQADQADQAVMLALVERLRAAKADTAKADANAARS